VSIEGQAGQEMTLIEWMAQLPSTHRACRELNAIQSKNVQLLAALNAISQDEFGDAYGTCDDGQNDYWRVVGIARLAVSAGAKP
jgi:hypothetical protein